MNEEIIIRLAITQLCARLCAAQVRFRPAHKRLKHLPLLFFLREQLASPF
jgi:hypothetical protein